MENNTYILKLNNGLEIKLFINFTFYDRNSNDVPLFVYQQIANCFQKNLSLFGILPYNNHVFQIEIPNQDELDKMDCILIEIVYYLSYNGEDSISVFLKKCTDTVTYEDFEEEVKNI